MIKDVFLSKRQLGTNHLSVGYESSQLWVRIVWVRNVHGYETSGFLFVPLLLNLVKIKIKCCSLFTDCSLVLKFIQVYCD